MINILILPHWGFSVFPFINNITGALLINFFRISSEFPAVDLVFITASTGFTSPDKTGAEAASRVCALEFYENTLPKSEIKQFSC
jgi:hypothetical protein